VLYVVIIGWLYVVLMMAVAEALAPNGSLVGACITFTTYGAIPLAIVLYIGGAPARRRARLATEASGTQPDGSGHAAGDAIASEREEP
jgi:hypothetical protein